MTNNKWIISTCKCGYLRLTLKKVLKVTKIQSAYHKTVNPCVFSHTHPLLTHSHHLLTHSYHLLNCSPLCNLFPLLVKSFPPLTKLYPPLTKSNMTTSEESQPMISYRSASYPTSRTNNKWIISTFKCGYLCLTLKKGPKVTKILSGYQKTVNPCVFSHTHPLLSRSHTLLTRSHQLLNCSPLTNSLPPLTKLFPPLTKSFPQLAKSFPVLAKSNMIKSEESQPMISYTLASYP